MANFFNRIFKRSADVKTNLVGSDPAITSGEPVNVSGPGPALTLATVYRCVSLISESVASLPLEHQTLRDGVFRTEHDRLTYLLSVEPNEWTSAYDFIKQEIQARLLFGEGYMIPQYDTRGEIKRMIMPRPGTGGPSTGIGVYMFNDHEQGISGEYFENEIIRVKGLTLDGVHCMSVISYAAQTASIAATADRNTLQSFANGGTTMGILSNEGGIPGYGEMQTDQLQTAADRLSQHLRRGDRLLALGGKWSYIPFTMTAADMQALENRKFTVREICRFFGVHPTFVFDDTSNNYKSAEMANVAFLSNTLNPILRQIENELDRKLMMNPAKERIRFNREELYATDLDSRMRYIEKRIQTGTMTPNEARMAVGVAPVEGGDTPLMSANLKPITELNQTRPNEEGNQ